MQCLHKVLFRALLSQLPALRYIAQLQNLKRLSLIDVPLQVRGDFLLEVSVF